MLDIPELGDMVCRLLGAHDLAQCARVDKKWNSLVVPYFWRDLTCNPTFASLPPLPHHGITILQPTCLSIGISTQVR